MHFNKNDQTGRSMVEMLGVLAIIGVLSVGGIAGYSKAMTKFKVSKTMDQVSMIVANIRTMYSGQRSYSGLTTDVAVNLGVVPSEMINGTEINNAFQSAVYIDASVAGDGGLTLVDQGFLITYTGLGREVCTTIVTADWGSGTSSGLMAIAVGKEESANPTVGSTGAVALQASTWVQAETQTEQGTKGYLPVAPADAATACGEDSNSITWVYF